MKPFMLPMLSALLCLMAGASSAAQPSSCAPMNGLNVVCGVQKPEDLVQIPGTRWLITSGYTPGGGVSLVDTDAKTARKFYTGAPAQQHPDKKLFPDCPAPPD